MMVNGEKEVPPKQEGETSFVNYMDASKNYDAARDPLGCDIILGEQDITHPHPNEIACVCSFFVGMFFDDLCFFLILSDVYCVESEY